MLRAAAGSWYTSVPFLTGASIVAVVVMGALGAFVAWRVGAPRKMLVYSMSDSTRLVSSEPLGLSRADIQVAYRGAGLTDPYVATLRLDSRSRRDIRSTDFDDGRPLIFDLGVKITAIVGLGPTGPAAEALSIAGSSVQLSPFLIRRGRVLRLSLLTEGEPHLTCQSPLADVKVEAYKPRMVLTVTVGASRLGLVALAASWLVAPAFWWVMLGLPKGVNWRLSSAISVAGFLSAILTVVLVSRITDKRMR